jgi:hypothetical protein
MLNAIPIKIPMAFFVEIGKKNPKIHLGLQNTQNNQKQS